MCVCCNVLWCPPPRTALGPQYIYNDLNFNRPFFLTYVSNTLFVGLVPVHKAFVLCRAKGLCGLTPQVNPVAPATMRKVGCASHVHTP